MVILHNLQHGYDMAVVKDRNLGLLLLVFWTAIDYERCVAQWLNVIRLLHYITSERVLSKLEITDLHTHVCMT